MDEKQAKAPNMQLVDIDRVAYMLQWRDELIAEQKAQLEAVDDVIAICAAYIKLIAVTAPEDVVIEKDALRLAVAELRGKVTYIDEGDRVRFVLVEEQTEDEAGDEDGEEGRGEEGNAEEEAAVEAEG